MKKKIITSLILILTFSSIAVATSDYQAPPALNIAEDLEVASTSRSAFVTSTAYSLGSNTSSPATVNSNSPTIQGSIDNDHHRWKSKERYEIASIDGYSEQYDIEEPIKFSVSGKSEKMDVTNENGFYVAAGLNNLTDSTGDIAVVEYISNKQTWQVSIAGKRDASKQYGISVYLVCGGGSSSPCAAVYGNGSKIRKTLPLQCTNDAYPLK